MVPVVRRHVFSSRRVVDVAASFRRVRVITSSRRVITSFRRDVIRRHVFSSRRVVLVVASSRSVISPPFGGTSSVFSSRRVVNVVTSSRRVITSSRRAPPDVLDTPNPNPSHTKRLEVPHVRHGASFFAQSRRNLNIHTGSRNSHGKRRSVEGDLRSLPWASRWHAQMLSPEHGAPRKQMVTNKLHNLHINGLLHTVQAPRVEAIRYILVVISACNET